MRATDASLLIVVLVIAWSMYRAHRSGDAGFANFNLIDIIVENGRVSKLACVFIGSFAVSSWVVIRLTLDGKMTELLFAAYGAMWVTPITAKLFSPAPPSSTSTQTTSTQTVTNP